jgi:hypothetical protein
MSSTSTNHMLALGFVHGFRRAGVTAFTNADGSTAFASWSRQGIYRVLPVELVP